MTTPADTLARRADLRQGGPAFVSNRQLSPGFGRGFCFSRLSHDIVSHGADGRMVAQVPYEKLSPGRRRGRGFCFQAELRLPASGGPRFLELGDDGLATKGWANIK